VTPELWIVAGPNGAGKTTLVSKEPVASLLPKVVFWNPDELARQILSERGFTGFASAPVDQLRSAFIEAADATFANLKNCISQGVPCGVETVLSTDKYKELVNMVLSAPGVFGLVYVGLRSPEIACQRVARRVIERGHDVPRDKIIARWSRSLENLSWFVAKASQFWIFDNSFDDPDATGSMIAEGSSGMIRWHDSNAIPELFGALQALPKFPA
jgi:predicted ABC-type ATPase